MLLAEPLTDRVIGLAIEVHRHTGPGLLESVYEQCLCRELAEAGIDFARQVVIPIVYKGAPVGDGFKAGIVVARELILEIKSVAAILPIHEMQLRTYLRMSSIRVGLVLNFNVPRLVDGLRRYVVQSLAWQTALSPWSPCSPHFLRAEKQSRGPHQAMA